MCRYYRVKNKFIMKKKVLASVVVGFSPLLAFAQDLVGIIGKLTAVVNAVAPFLIGLAVVYFMWNVAKYVLSADGKEEARTGMIWGIIGIFVMSSVWALVAVLGNTLGI